MSIGYKVEIKNDGRRTEILLDGQPLSHVTAYKVGRKVDEPTTLTVTLIAKDVKMEWLP